MIHRHRETAAEPVFVEAVFGPGAGVADAACVLDSGELLLRAYGAGGVEGVLVRPATLDCCGVGLGNWVEGYENIAVDGGRDVLEDVHVVGEADGCGVEGCEG